MIYYPSCTEEHACIIDVAENGRISIDNKKTNFKMQEFVNRRIWNKYGMLSIQQMDPAVIIFMDAIRRKSGMYVVGNNWHVGGQFEKRGRREGWTKVGALDSQHKIGRAQDFNFVDPKSGRYWKSKEVYEFIMDHEELFYSYGVRAIEHYSLTSGSTGIGWTHLDCRPTFKYNSLIIIKNG